MLSQPKTSPLLRCGPDTLASVCTNLWWVQREQLCCLPAALPLLTSAMKTPQGAVLHYLLDTINVDDTL